MSGIRTRLLGIFRHRIGRPALIKREQIQGRNLALLLFVGALDTPDQPQLLKLAQMHIQRAARHLAVVRQRLLRGETAIVRVVPVAQLPQHQLCRGLQSTLRDGPICCCMAHTIHPRLQARQNARAYYYFAGQFWPEFLSLSPPVRTFLRGDQGGARDLVTGNPPTEDRAAQCGTARTKRRAHGPKRVQNSTRKSSRSSGTLP